MTSEGTILLVDDKSDDIEITIGSFRCNGFLGPVATAIDGTECLDYLHRRGRYVNRTAPNPILILLAIKVPTIDGFQVLREIRSHREFLTIPVVMYSSSRLESDLRTAYELGANGYVVKPVTFEAINEVTRKILGYWLRLNELPGWTPETFTADEPCAEEGRA